MHIRGLFRKASGKSTILESIAVAFGFNVEGRIKNFNFSSNATHSDLNHVYGGRSLHEQSHGESFFSVFQNKFCGESVYILDEPEAALSPSKQMSMLTRMHQLVGEGSQFIIVTHSPIIMKIKNIIKSCLIYYWNDEVGINI